MQRDEANPYGWDARPTSLGEQKTRSNENLFSQVPRRAIKKEAQGILRLSL